jgi:CRP-like cAMP-binding protein
MLSSRDLALRSGIVLDIPPRTAALLVAGGLAGVVLLLVATLTGGRPETVPVDKLLHFLGFSGLGAVFMLGLRPRWFVPALLGLAGLGLAIEVLQPLNRRAFEWSDAAADLLGVALGAAGGLAVRWLYGFLKTELDEARVRRRLTSYRPGETIIRQGEPLDTFLIVKRGGATLYREDDGTRVPIADAGPGDMLGLLAEVQRRPADATVVATAPTQVYRLDFDVLIEAAGGRAQPLGAVVEALADDLREAWDRLAALEARPAAGGEPLPASRPALGLRHAGSRHPPREASAARPATG